MTHCGARGGNPVLVRKEGRLGLLSPVDRQVGGADCHQQVHRLGEAWLGAGIGDL